MTCDACILSYVMHITFVIVIVHPRQLLILFRIVGSMATSMSSENKASVGQLRRL